MKGNATEHKQNPTQKTLRRLFLIVTVCFLLALLICMIIRSGELEVFLTDGAGAKAEGYLPDSDLVEARPSPKGERFLTVTASGHRTGKAFITDPDGRFVYVRVLPGSVIYNVSNGNFSGCREVTSLAAAYTAVTALLAVLSFVIRCRTDLFSYGTLYMGGTMLFLSVFAADLLPAAARQWLSPETYFMLNVYSSLKGAGQTFMLLTLPFMLVSAAALVVSNLSLVRHEGKKFTNLLAVAMSGLIAAGYFGFFLLDNTFTMGSERQMRIYGTVISVYSTIFVYLEAMLMSAMLCGLIAAHKKPGYDRTHMIILGCAIAPDGTPLPLLRARIEKALSFAKEQREAGGCGIKFVPSGGQGPGEVVAEAAAMENYLLSRGAGAEDILPEAASTNTKENMRFSLRKIREDCPDAKIAFSTSGYHVLRSGMISREEGLDAEGLGCRTKWYFWPNAFIREFIGLLSVKWKEHVFWILCFSAAFFLINMIMPM